jgi:hypothetical protein
MKFVAVIAGILVAGIAGAQTFTFTHTWDGTEPTQLSRLSRNGVASVFGGPKTFPGTINLTETYSYQVYTITNNLGAVAQLTTTTTADSSNSFTEVYLGTFDPTNLAKNYYGDEGVSSSATTSSSAVYGPFNAGATITIVSAGLVNPKSVSGTYSITAVLSTVAAPEPSGIATLGLGLGALLVRRRIKKA